jgi:flagellar hook-associated protein 3 FlgL
MAIRISQYDTTIQTSNQLAQMQAELAKLQQKMASGVNVSSASDDPIAYAQIQSLNASLNQLNRFETNVATANSRLNIVDTVMEQMVSVLQEARTMAVQGASGTQDGVTREALSFQVRGFIDRMITLGNTQDAEGNYLFSGDKAEVIPFSLSRNASNVVVDDATNAGTYSPLTYQGSDESNRFAQVGFDSDFETGIGSTRIPIGFVGLGTNASSVFSTFSAQRLTGGVPDQESVQTDVFGALMMLAEDLEANRAPLTSIANIDKALDQIIGARSVVGARLGTIEAQADANSAMKLELEDTRSNLQDLDIGAAIVQFQAKKLALEMAQYTFQQMQQMRLFNNMR